MHSCRGGTTLSSGAHFPREWAASFTGRKGSLCVALPDIPCHLPGFLLIICLIWRLALIGHRCVNRKRPGQMKQSCFAGWISSARRADTASLGPEELLIGMDNHGPDALPCECRPAFTSHHVLWFCRGTADMSCTGLQSQAARRQQWWPTPLPTARTWYLRAITMSVRSSKQS